MQASDFIKWYDLGDLGPLEALYAIIEEKINLRSCVSITQYFIYIKIFLNLDFKHIEISPG